MPLLCLCWTFFLSHLRCRGGVTLCMCLLHPPLTRLTLTCAVKFSARVLLLAETTCELHVVMFETPVYSVAKACPLSSCALCDSMCQVAASPAPEEISSVTSASRALVQGAEMLPSTQGSAPMRMMSVFLAALV